MDRTIKVHVAAGHQETSIVKALVLTRPTSSRPEHLRDSKPPIKGQIRSRKHQSSDPDDSSMTASDAIVVVKKLWLAGRLSCDPDSRERTRRSAARIDGSKAMSRTVSHNDWSGGRTDGRAIASSKSRDWSGCS